MRYLFLFFVIFQIAIKNILFASSNLDVLRAEQIAEKFQYKGKLDSLNGVAKSFKKEGNFLWGESYQSQDQVIGYMIIFYQFHSYLNSNFISNFTNAEKGLHERFLKSESDWLTKINQTTDLQKQQEIRADYEVWREKEMKDKSMKSLKLKNGSTAYFHPLLGGPGGGGLIVEVDDYLKRFDLMVITFIRNYMDDVVPGDTNVIILPETKEYLKKLDSFGSSYEMLQLGVETLYPAIEAQYQKIVSGTAVTNQTNLSLSPPQSKENQLKPEIKQSDIPSEKPTSNWIWIGLALLGLVIGLIVFYYRRNK